MLRVDYQDDYVYVQLSLKAPPPPRRVDVGWIRQRDVSEWFVGSILVGKLDEDFFN